jgi:hypothetical protein
VIDGVIAIKTILTMAAFVNPMLVGGGNRADVSSCVMCGCVLVNILPLR